MNPNYLLKEELEYELRIRGFYSQGDVQLLRKIFRSVMSEDDPIKLENLGEINPLEQWECICFKVAELERLVDNPSSNYAQLSARVKTRVKHLTDRLSHVRSLVTLPAEVSTLAIDGHISRLAEIERKFISVPACDDLLSVQQDSILEAAATNLTVEATDTECQLDSSANLTPGPVLNTGFQPTVSTGICIQSNSDSSTPFRLQQTSYNTDNSIFPPLASVATTPFNFSICNKLTHPVEGLLRELPVVDGLEVKALLDFFRKVIKIHTLCTISDRALFEVIYPNCREPLCARVCGIEFQFDFRAIPRGCTPIFYSQKAV
jgi:hypothetical protein